GGARRPRGGPRANPGRRARPTDARRAGGMSGGPFTAFLEAAVRTATPLAYAALRELLVERAGEINIGLDGAIIGGAFGALVFAGAGGVSLGFAGAALAGTLVAALFALFVVTLRTDQISTGTAMTMLEFGRS